MKRLFALSVLVIALFISGCPKNSVAPLDNSTRKFGYYGTDTMSKVPVSTQKYGFKTTNLPDAVDLQPKFPPIGDQGQYGTCVAWSVAYNYRSAINGISKGLTQAQLASPSNQFSPRDLFTNIPDNAKGTGCDGTNFATALSLAQSRGIATLATVPYSNLGDCSQNNAQAGWSSDANQHKIKSWRKIEPAIDAIKENLANGIPVMFGAKLADNFMTYTGGVISSATGYDKVGIHAYHAMVIAGYDNNKGPKGAFKIINSWSQSWGDNGVVWVDYDFFINEFCVDTDNSGKPLFTAVSDDGTTPPGPSPTTTGVDLAAWAFSDVSTVNSNYPTQRQINYNIYNIGTQPANPDANWSVYYIFYNAFDATDYGIIFYDEFNTSIQANTYYCPTTDHCIINIALPAGDNFANIAYSQTSLFQTYLMPDITGIYYILLIADGSDVFAEDNEMNNIFYTTNDPVYFQNGIYGKTSAGAFNNYSHYFNFINSTKGLPDLASLKHNKYNTAVTSYNLNAYRPDEITDFLKYEHKSGRLQAKINAYKSSKTNWDVLNGKK